MLLRKSNKSEDKLTSFRSICLEEVGKLFERILNSRLQAFLEREGELSDYQFGFRANKSTIDTILCLKKWVQNFERIEVITRWTFRMRSIRYHEESYRKHCAVIMLVNT